jgi:hypothetical protein
MKLNDVEKSSHGISYGTVVTVLLADEMFKLECKSASLALLLFVDWL